GFCGYRASLRCNQQIGPPAHAVAAYGKGLSADRAGYRYAALEEGLRRLDRAVRTSVDRTAGIRPDAGQSCGTGRHEKRLGALQGSADGWQAEYARCEDGDGA